MIGKLFMAAIMIGTAILSYNTAQENDKLNFFNKGHMLRFSVLFCIFQLMTFFCGILPKEFIPISLFAVIISIFSNGFIGLLSLVLFVSYYGILNVNDPTMLSCLMLAGAIGVAAFNETDLSKTFAPRIAAYVSADFICNGIVYLSFGEGESVVRFILFSLIRCVVSGFIIYALLKIMADRYVFDDHMFYSEVCDPGCEYLMSIESRSKSAYNRALHNAYLAEKIAAAMGYDTLFVKAGAYYLNARKYDVFGGVRVPSKFKRLMNALWNPDKDLIDDKNYDVKFKKEVAIIRFSDMYLKAVLYSFKKNENITPDYGKLTEVVVKKMIKEGDRIFTLFSLNELNELKSACKAEKKYYEFLRRQ